MVRQLQAVIRHPALARQRAQSTLGQRAAEKLAQYIGSWSFLIGQSLVLVAWVALNVVAVIRHWDPYPFILLNLCLSFQAAYTGPILLIASNRTEERDHLLADHHYGETQILEQLLRQNTELTERVRALSEEMREHILQGDR